MNGKIAAAFSIRRFAYQTAGPRDFLINLIVNGVIAWFVFHGEHSVFLAGSNTIFKMLLPMSLIETTLTSFFGFLGGTLEIRNHSNQPRPIQWRRWFVFAIGGSLIRGFMVFCIFAAAMTVFQQTAVSISISGYFVAPIIGLISGALAYVMHSNAVIRSERLLECSTVTDGN